jgi:hypothetical protein
VEVKIDGIGSLMNALVPTASGLATAG